MKNFWTNMWDVLKEPFQQLKRIKKLKKRAMDRLPKRSDNGHWFYWDLKLVTPIAGYEPKTGRPIIRGMSFIVGFHSWYDSSDKWSAYKMALGHLNGKYKISSSFQGLGSEHDIEGFLWRSGYMIQTL